MLKDKIGRRLIGVFFLFVALFNYPLISLFNGPERIWGAPRFYVSIFMAWLAMIVCLWWVLREKRSEKG